ncbi:hypothetical protein [Synoicihabitans lomoniglobus]|uniref:Uncharacterized protein n=1 Tax=Synoicihabitans lomoniglobus TaxID=2909285 RepID=A0AAE9ZZK0_9BACT|nr:hypothetical protein [Opitutaceae bacterium LMO-M01]WED63487.1 hypothetical protein PXH66_14195 [Opitutaceae bacterium LMO-M01]
MKKLILLLLASATISLSPLWAQENPDRDQPLVNISTRTTITPDNPRVIVGFTVPGNPDPDRPLYPKTLLLRAIGPGLAQFAVTNALADPQVQVFNAAEVEISANWSDFTAPLNPDNENDATAAVRATNAASVAETAAALGAFAVVVPTVDTPVVADYSNAIGLPGGNYTVVVSSKSGGTGDVVVEVYSVHN